MQLTELRLICVCTLDEAHPNVFISHTPPVMSRPMDVLADTPYTWLPISMTSYDGWTL